MIPFFFHFSLSLFKLRVFYSATKEKFAQFTGILSVIIFLRSLSSSTKDSHYKSTYNVALHRTISVMIRKLKKKLQYIFPSHMCHVCHHDTCGDTRCVFLRKEVPIHIVFLLLTETTRLMSRCLMSVITFVNDR